MRCFCFLHNVMDLLWDGSTAYEKRFDDFYTGPEIPFMAEVEYKPSAPKVKNQMHHFGSKLLPGLFIGYYQRPGGLWGGDLFVVDWQEAERAAAGVCRCRIRLALEPALVWPEPDLVCCVVWGRCIFSWAEGGWMNDHFAIVNSRREITATKR